MSLFWAVTAEDQLRAVIDALAGVRFPVLDAQGFDKSPLIAQNWVTGRVWLVLAGARF
jgi:hypothetical protein